MPFSNKDLIPNPAMKAVIREIQDRLHLQFIYVRADDIDFLVDENTPPVYSKHGGLTIAYVLPNHDIPHNIVWVALSWCNPEERFNKTTGKFFASTRYEKGNIVPIRLTEGGNIPQQLTELFYDLV
jgi:hypothetical protein